MAEGNWSVIRVEKISAEGAQKTERHNERKNESYANLNVDTEQIARNVHFKDTGGLTYNEYFQRLIDEGKISTRGQKASATIFNELVIDVNTRYFEEHGGYEYAKQFYEEAYRFGCEIYGEENIVSAVMHADEINKAVSEDLGKPVYHYHLHIVAIPTVRKEILWSKRCKDEALRGTVKEVINQVSHSKKWKNTVPLLDENGQQVISKYGKPMFRKSYSVLQDKLFEHKGIGSFRVDRIARCPKILDDDAVYPPKNFDLNVYLNSMFRMYNGQRKQIELVCSNDVMDAIIDKFGKDVHVLVNDMKSFRAIIETSVGSVFYSWIFGFGGKVVIKSPEDVKDEYSSMVLNAGKSLGLFEYGESENQTV